MGISNFVEALADESAFDQPCKFGNRVGTHSVYCHSEHPMAPRKCRHTWYYGKDKKGYQDKDCEFFEPNPEYHELGKD